MERTLGRLTGLLAPAVGVVYVVLWWIGEAGRLGNGPQGPLVSLVPFVLFGVVIAVSQRWPAVALALLGVGLVIQLVVEGARFGSTSWAAYLPLLYAVFNISAFGRPVPHRLSLPVVIVYAVTVGLLLTLPALGQQGWPVFYSLESARAFQRGGEFELISTVPVACVITVGLAVGSWCAGLALRVARQAQDARQHAQSLERGLAIVEGELVALSERERLARDVHDVMAHSLAVIAAQADGARMSDPSLAAGARDALTTIADTARDGLTELRHLLDAAPDDTDASHPVVADLPTLFDRVRAAGLECEFAEFGDAKPLLAGQQLGVYRIVQEALTNAVRHAGEEATAKVTLDWRGPGLAILIATPAEATSPSRPGRGIRGMQERARLAGGWLTADADERGTFIVNAFIPDTGPGAAEAAA
ncbi:sensor histidine kinase [Agromyces bauzanensis]